jgi:hypothetical protein
MLRYHVQQPLLSGTAPLISPKAYAGTQEGFLARRECHDARDRTLIARFAHVAFVREPVKWIASARIASWGPQVPAAWINPKWSSRGRQLAILWSKGMRHFRVWNRGLEAHMPMYVGRRLVLLIVGVAASSPMDSPHNSCSGDSGWSSVDTVVLDARRCATLLKRDSNLAGTSRFQASIR